MNYKLINMKVMGDERGKLVSLEGGQNIPFDIKRVYYIFDTLPDQERGHDRFHESAPFSLSRLFSGLSIVRGGRNYLL